MRKDELVSIGHSGALLGSFVYSGVCSDCDTPPPNPSGKYGANVCNYEEILLVKLIGVKVG